MTDRRFRCNWRFIFAALLSPALCLSLVTPLLGAAPASQSQKQIIESIKQCARDDVKDGVSRQTDAVWHRFENNSAGLDEREIKRIYEKEYIAKKKSANTGFEWRDIFWQIVAAVLAALLFVGKTLAKWIAASFGKIWQMLYDRLAGTKLLRSIALAKYEKALLAKYEDIKVPFRRNRRPLKMSSVFVPLKVHAGSGRRDTDDASTAQPGKPEDGVDILEALAENRVLMVLGAPGSGKTVLLRHLALAYADRTAEYLPDEPIPVLLEMHRLSDEDKTLQEQLVEELARNDFPHGENFISRGLQYGTLLLLFDGLDEVESERRTQVVQRITDLMDKYEKCRVIISCRVAVYNDEFAEAVRQTLEIVEFSDQQIQQFLSAWQADMPPEKSVEQLLRALHDRPRVMALARNPLLLTIIAYLYSDANFILPRSRAEFYQKATELLLEQWHQQHNRYRMREKRSVLQHLAVRFFEVADRSEKDRRSVGFDSVLTEVEAALPDVRLDPAKDAQPLLDEIVERSGLLLSIDRGARYQFAHLTLQEYFAAEAFLNDEQELLPRFKDDPRVWREVVSLWCGLGVDCTNLIQEVHKIDPLAAFECLADAEKLDAATASGIIGEFHDRLPESDAIIATFAAVASGLHGRDAGVFEFLKDTLNNAPEKPRRTAAAVALSMTDRPEGAVALASTYEANPEVLRHLARMGDLAVPYLANILTQTDTQVSGNETKAVAVLDALAAISTPLAAKSIIPYLWDAGDQVRFQAATHLGSMISDERIVDELRTTSVSDLPVKASELDWIWEPFDAPSRSALPIVGGRTAELLYRPPVPAPDEQPRTLDSRIVIPLLTGIVADNLRSVEGDRLVEDAATLVDQRAVVDVTQRSGSRTAADWITMYAKDTPLSRYRRLMFGKVVYQVLLVAAVGTFWLGPLGNILSLSVIGTIYALIFTWGQWYGFRRAKGIIDTEAGPERTVQDVRVLRAKLFFYIVAPQMLKSKHKFVERIWSIMGGVYFPILMSAGAVAYFTMPSWNPERAVELPKWFIIIVGAICGVVAGASWLSLSAVRRYFQTRNPYRGCLPAAGNRWTRAKRSRPVGIIRRLLSLLRGNRL